MKLWDDGPNDDMIIFEIKQGSPTDNINEYLIGLDNLIDVFYLYWVEVDESLELLGKANSYDKIFELLAKEIQEGN